MPWLSQQYLRPFKLNKLPLALATATSISFAAHAQTAPNSSVVGVKHVLEGTLRGEELSSSEAADRPDGDLQVTLQLSDHAPDARFFGKVVARFSEVGPARQGRQTVWEDRKCHRDRGLPKVTVVGITGTISKGDQKVAVSADVRRVGRLVPEDEIVVTRLPASLAQSGSAIAIRATTKTSRLVLELLLSTLRCQL